MNGWLYGAVVCLAIAGFNGSSAFGQADHRQIQYDPSKCAKDAHDMVYFAVGRRVLRQPKANLTYISGASVEFMNALPRPPMPDEPEGCPDHPI